MLNPSKAIVFDVDAATLASLREALPGWQIYGVYGATVGSLPCDWNPGHVDLFVAAMRPNTAETLGLCQFLVSSMSKESRQKRGEAFVMPGRLRNQATRLDAPLLVLVPCGQENLIEAALESGAHSCLMLPIYAKEVASMLVHAQAGNQPGRHTLDLERAQVEDRWRDDGGQG